MLINKASDVILGDRRRDSSILSNVTLCINQTGPNEPNLTIVDLPGIVCGKQVFPKFPYSFPFDIKVVLPEYSRPRGARDNTLSSQ